MQRLGLNVKEQDAEADIIEQAVNDVLLADVISRETKVRMVDCLTVLRTGLDCPDFGCVGCFHRQRCERLVEGILGTE